MYLELDQKDCMSTAIIDSNGSQVTYGELMCFAQEFKKVIGKTFELKPGSRIALTGKNGCGKTSLLKLLCGADIRYTGSIEMPSRLKVSYVPQDPSGLYGTLAEYARRCGVDEERFRAMLGKLDFTGPQYNSRIEDYSDGQKKKVLLARSLCEDANLFIWDEPLNFVDILSRIQIENAILEYQPSILFVEHDKVFCDRVATEIVEIRSGT